VSLAWVAYRMLAPCAGALAPGARALASPSEQRLWGERLGSARLEGGCHAWIHAASLGEAAAVPPLVRELTSLQPGARLYLTATTRTGRARLGELPHPVSLAPIDTPQAARRFFAGVRPQRLFLVETELWPHWLLRARSEGVPVAVVSARLSERSVARYRRLGAGFRRLVAGLAGVLCQGASDERRWLELGARRERTAVVGNLKDDGLPPSAPDRVAARKALGLDHERPLLVLGSLRPGEVRPLARALGSLPEGVRDRWQVVAVPRHARAGGELLDEARRAAQVLVRSGAPRRGAWRWDDGTGVLGGYYAAADVAFVGGSLGPYGGHNPLEPAACGAAVVVGRHHEAQADGVQALRERDAVTVVRGEDELAPALARLLTDEGLRAARAAAALETVRDRRGAARRAVERLASWDLWPAD